MKKLAIIGTGIAGLGAAHHLKNGFDLEIFERNDYPGGHTNTITVEEEDGRRVPIDTGFMVFNETTYPGLTRLFDELDVEIAPTNMSFGVQNLDDRLEWAGGSLGSVFSQRRNLLSPRFHRFLATIQRFNADARRDLERGSFENMTLEELVRARGYGSDLLELYLLPISSAIWSTPLDRIGGFPAATLLRFFSNHGLLNGIRGGLTWRTVAGGAATYVRKLIEPIRDRIHLRTAVASVEESSNGVTLHLRNGARREFDAVILATHADQSLRMLRKPSALQQALLRPYRYEKNVATLHTDPAPMPSEKRAWASWNYRMETVGDRVEATTIYWMNSLQNVSDRNDYFVSINDPGLIDPARVITRIDYRHPIFDLASIRTQRVLPEINHESPGQRIFFCGSYFGHGFHEDAYQSSLSLVEIVKRRVGSKAA